MEQRSELGRHEPRNQGLLATSRSSERGRESFLPGSLPREPALNSDFWPPALEENKFLTWEY